MQFSVPGPALDYFVIYGPTPEEILRKYTALTGRPALPPAWSFGLWLTTSFTHRLRRADRDAARRRHGRARHAAAASSTSTASGCGRCHWCDFEWDRDAFPDPAAMLQRLKERGLRICVWINPYIAQRSPLFAEAARRGLPRQAARRQRVAVGHVAAGHGRWWTSRTPPPASGSRTSCARCCDMGVDCFKTDFGERIPEDVVWSDGSDPERMHNYYTLPLQPDRLRRAASRRTGEGEAVLFARSATAGGQQFPVHWGGDCESTFESMAESLRGGLSLGLVRLRLLEPRHRRLRGHADRRRCSSAGSPSACSPRTAGCTARARTACRGCSTRRPSRSPRAFTRLKMRLMPYLFAAAVAGARGAASR